MVEALNVCESQTKHFQRLSIVITMFFFVRSDVCWYARWYHKEERCPTETNNYSGSVENTFALVGMFRELIRKLNEMKQTETTRGERGTERETDDGTTSKHMIIRCVVLICILLSKQDTIDKVMQTKSRKKIRKSNLLSTMNYYCYSESNH